MKNLLVVLLFVPLVSIGQSSYTSYYENGKLKVAGEFFEEIIGSKVSAKSGLNVRMSPNLKSKTIGKLLYGIPVTVESKTGKKLTDTKEGRGEEFLLPKKTMKKGKIDLSGTIQANIKKIIKEGM